MRVSMTENDGEVLKALLEAARRALEGETQEEANPPESMPIAFDAANIKFAVRVWVPSCDYRKINKKLLLSIREVFAERGIKMV